MLGEREVAGLFARRRQTPATQTIVQIGPLVGAAIQQAGKASSHWALLDFLRAASALLVLFAHSRPFYFLNIDFASQPNVFLKLFYFVTGLGHEAVVIFFVLSGFLIGGSLTDSMLRGGFSLPHYLIARFARIYTVFIPALIITEAIFFFGGLALTDPGDVPPWIAPLFFRRQLDFGGVSQAICFAAGLQGFSCPSWEQNPVLWSLGYEWALYLFAPAIIQLLVWKTSRSLRLLAIALACAIVATLCRDPRPDQAVFWVGVWFLGAGAYRVMRGGRVPMPAGLAGAALMIVGMFMRHVDAAGQMTTDMIIAAGAFLVVACRPLAAFPLAPRFSAWAAGFSYTLYVLHAPIIYLIVTWFRQIGFPPDIPPSLAPFMEFGVTIAICLLAAYLVSLFTERKTPQIRAALMRLYPSRADREAGDAGIALKLTKFLRAG